VALARALAPEPVLLLLDEPLAALDASTRMTVRAELRHQLAVLDQAVITVTHDPVDAAVLGERMLVLEGGRLVQQGTPAQVAQRPRSDYVARLVGLNLIEGTADATTLRVGRTTVHGANPCTGPACAAFRPAAVSVHLDRPGGSFRNVWSGTVAHVQPHGEAARVEVAGAVDDRPVTAEVTQVAVAELGLVPGRRVWVAVKASDVDLYPA
jgi:molybdate transport system ATP-binding protein